MKANEITMPMSVDPVLPNVCIYSLEKDPDDFVSITNSLPGAYHNAYLKIPMCKKYKNKYALDIVLRYLSLTFVALFVAGIFFVCFHYTTAISFQNKLVFSGALGVGGGLYFDLKFVPLIDLVIGNDRITYVFRSKEYARQFAALNAVNITNVKYAD